MKIAVLQASFFIAALILASGGYAFPAINNLSIQESNLWLGESNTIFLNCTDSNSTALGTPYADITTSTAIFPDNLFVLDSDGNYYLPISTGPLSNFNIIGTFNATVYCKNTADEAVNGSVSFTVSNLSMEINKVTSPVYLGDAEEANLFVKKNGNTITSDIDFSITLNGAGMELLSPPYYDFAKGWVLRFSTSGLSAGIKTLSINAGYGRASVSSSSEIKAANTIEFSSLGVDKTWLSSNDEVVVQLKATERGNPVQIKKEHLSVQIDSAAAGIIDVLPASAGAYAVKFSAPSMPAGAHTLKVGFSYNNFSDTYSKGIYYVIPVSGNIFVAAEKSAQVQLRFTSSETDKTVKADGSGAYSILLPPAKYNIQISDGIPTLEIDNANIGSFDDGIKYQPLASGTVAGIQGAGIYYYGAAFEYSGARLKLPYDQSKINDESLLQAYACENWNSGKKSCASDWKTTESKIDTIRKIAAINITSLNAAYLIGSPDNAGIEARSEKDIYGLSEKIKITGISLDGAKNILPEASVTVSLGSLPVIASAKSNAQGIFSLELDSPGTEGTYTATIIVSKTPYVSSQKQVKFTVVKTSDITIMGPDTIRMNPGDITDVQFRIMNIGEADLSGVKISIKGLPSNYYRITPSDTIDQIKAGAERSVSVHFEIPDDASKATFGASIEASKGDFARSVNFALSVLPSANISSSVIITQTPAPVKSDPVSGSNTSFSLGMPTAFSTFFAAESDMAYLAAFAAISFSAALLLRKRRIISNKYSVSGKRSINRNILFDLKNKVTESERTREKKSKERRFSRYSKNW